MHFTYISCIITARVHSMTGGSGPARGGQVQPAGGGQVSPAGGGVRSGPARGVRSSRGGVRSVQRARGWVRSSRQAGVSPASGGGGSVSGGGGSASCALLRVVCFLRSRRRTFLLFCINAMLECGYGATVRRGCHPRLQWQWLRMERW